MGANMHIKFISEGFRQILMSDGTRALVESQANAIRDAANATINGESEGFEVTVMQGNYGGGRWVAFVQTTDYESMKAESEYKALTGAIRR